MFAAAAAVSASAPKTRIWKKETLSSCNTSRTWCCHAYSHLSASAINWMSLTTFVRLTRTPATSRNFVSSPSLSVAARSRETLLPLQICISLQFCTCDKECVTLTEWIYCAGLCWQTDEFVWTRQGRVYTQSDRKNRNIIAKIWLIQTKVTRHNVTGYLPIDFWTSTFLTQHFEDKNFRQLCPIDSLHSRI